MPVFKYLIVAILFSSITACSTVKPDWEHAKKINTRDSYNAFLEKHPKSKYRPYALEGIIDLEWEQILSKDEIKGYREFVDEHPSHRLTKLAEQRIEELEEELDWEEAKRKNTLSSYRSYERSYETGKFSAEANKLIKEMKGVILKNGITKVAAEITKEEQGIAGAEVTNFGQRSNSQLPKSGYSFVIITVSVNPKEFIYVDKINTVSAVVNDETVKAIPAGLFSKWNPYTKSVHRGVFPGNTNNLKFLFIVHDGDLPLTKIMVLDQEYNLSDIIQ